ncbi:hypothetical protein BH09BAC3_BH09BAC3_27990 [soil metagenome]
MRAKRYIGMSIISLLLLSPSRATCFQSDSLKFISSFEKQIFDSVRLKFNTSGLPLFLMYDKDSSSYASARRVIDNFYETILGPKLKTKDEKSQAKIIFEEVHKAFLIKYSDTVSFSSIFRNGLYNCVSGSAMYSIVLSHYQIPYEIREVPTHVYVIAYPKSHNILFESTDPRGYYSLSDKSIESQIEALVNAGYVLRPYVNEVGARKAFNEFFYSRTSIDIQNLAGIQYWNGSLRDRNKELYEKALEKVEKADALFPMKRNKYFKVGLLNNILANLKFDKMEDVKYMIQYANIVNSEESARQVNSAFQSIIGQQLIRNSKEQFINDAYALLSEGLNNKELIKELRRTKNLGFAKFKAIKNRMDESLAFAQIEYGENPNDAEIQELITNVVVQKAASTIASPSGIKALSAYVAKYPFLNSNELVLRTYVYGYASLSVINFTADHGKEGHRYMQLMEAELARRGKDAIMDESIIGYPYAEAGAFYFRLHDYNSSLKWMERGLKFAPEHPEIKIRIQITKDEIKVNTK